MWAHAREASREAGGVVGKVAHRTPLEFSFGMGPSGGKLTC